MVPARSGPVPGASRLCLRSAPRSSWAGEGRASDAGTASYFYRGPTVCGCPAWTHAIARAATRRCGDGDRRRFLAGLTSRRRRCLGTRLGCSDGDAGHPESLTGGTRGRGPRVAPNPAPLRHTRPGSRTPPCRPPPNLRTAAPHPPRLPDSGGAGARPAPVARRNNTEQTLSPSKTRIRYVKLSDFCSAAL